MPLTPFTGKLTCDCGLEDALPVAFEEPSCPLQRLLAGLYLAEQLLNFLHDAILLFPRSEAYYMSKKRTAIDVSHRYSMNMNGGLDIHYAPSMPNNRRTFCQRFLMELL